MDSVTFDSKCSALAAGVPRSLVPDQASRVVTVPRQRQQPMSPPCARRKLIRNFLFQGNSRHGRTKFQTSPSYLAALWGRDRRPITSNKLPIRPRHAADITVRTQVERSPHSDQLHDTQCIVVADAGGRARLQRCISSGQGAYLNLSGMARALDSQSSRLALS